MSWTKKQLIEQAFEEIGISNYIYDLTPEQLQSALNKMDAMVASWETKGVRINYPMSNNPMSADINSNSCVPSYAHEAIYLNLALRIAPSFGKVLPQETKQSAHEAYSNLLSKNVQVIQRSLTPDLPAGQGNKPWRGGDNVYILPPESQILIGGDGILEL